MGFIMAFAYNPSYTLLMSSIILSGSLPTSSSPHPNTLASSIISHAVRLQKGENCRGGGEKREGEAGRSGFQPQCSHLPAGPSSHFTSLNFFSFDYKIGWIMMMLT